MFGLSIKGPTLFKMSIFPSENKRSLNSLSICIYLPACVYQMDHSSRMTRARSTVGKCSLLQPWYCSQFRSPMKTPSLFLKSDIRGKICNQLLLEKLKFNNRSKYRHYKSRTENSNLTSEETQLPIVTIDSYL